MLNEKMIRKLIDGYTPSIVKQLDNDENMVICKYVDENKNSLELWYTLMNTMTIVPTLFSIDFHMCEKDKDDYNEVILQEPVKIDNDTFFSWPDIHIEGGPDIAEFGNYQIDWTKENISLMKKGK